MKIFKVLPRLFAALGVAMLLAVSGWGACGTTITTWNTSSTTAYNHSDSVGDSPADDYTISVASDGNLSLKVKNTQSPDKSLNVKLYSTSDCSGTPLWNNNLTTTNSLGQQSFTVTSGTYHLEIIANVNFTISYDLNGTFTPIVDAINDSYSIASTGVLTGNVLINDVGSSLSVTSYTSPSHGTLSITNSTGAFTYTPTSGYAGADDFNYTIQGSGGVTDTAKVSITVTNPSLADLNISKTAPAESVLVGSDFNYAINVGNQGGASVSDLNVTDILPSGITYKSFTGTGWTYTAPKTWSYNNILSAGAMAPVLNITVTAPNSPALITNNTVAVTTTAVENTTSNNTAISPQVSVVAVNLTCSTAPEFFTIDGSETNITGKSTLGSINHIETTGTYFKFNANATAGDINGTLAINVYSSNFNNISVIEFLDQNCNPIYTTSNVEKWTMSEFITSPIHVAKIRYLRISDTANNNPAVVVSMLWYPDVNVTSGGGGVPNYTEPAIFKAAEVNGFPNYIIKTKVVNKPHDISVYVVKSDGTIFTNFKGSFMLELVDGTSYPATTCKNLPLLKYDGILGIASNDNGMMTTGDNSTAHGPQLIYDKAHRQASYRMTYLVDPTQGGIIDYNDLILTTGCVGNTQSCLWGVLTSLASTKKDPYYPDFTIADVCGMFCQPGNGTGNNQVSQACSQCVFGQFGYSDCSDKLAIRPDHFDSNLSSLQPLIAKKETSIAFHANQFSGVGALDYNESETQATPSFVVDVNISDSSKICAQSTMNFTPRISFTDGNISNSYTLPNVGDFNVTMHEINGSEFAYVDRFDTNETLRMITPSSKHVNVVPASFNIEGNLTNGSNGFTYLSNFQDYNTTASRNISAGLDLNITAWAYDDNVTSNYTGTCYAKDGNITVLIDTFGMTPAGAVTKMLWYEKNHDTNGSMAIPVDHFVMPILHTAFDATGANGTALVKYLLNFDRNQTKTVDPKLMVVQSVTATDADAVTGTEIPTTNSAYYVYGRNIPRDVRVFGSVPFSANGWYEVFGTTAIGTTALAVSKNDSQWSTNKLHNDVSDGDANVTVVVSTTSTTLPVWNTSNNTGIESYLFNAETPPYSAKAHILNAPWLWYGLTASAYANPVAGNSEAACLTHPCFNINVVPAVGATGSAKSTNTDTKASKKSDSSGWRSTTDYAPAVR